MTDSGVFSFNERDLLVHQKVLADRHAKRKRDIKRLRERTIDESTVDGSTLIKLVRALAKRPTPRTGNKKPNAVVETALELQICPRLTEDKPTVLWMPANASLVRHDRRHYELAHGQRSVRFDWLNGRLKVVGCSGYNDPNCGAPNRPVTRSSGGAKRVVRDAS